MRTREETLPASEQIAQTAVIKLQILKLLPSQSWGKRLLEDIETIYARNYFPEKSREVLEKQGHWIARRRWISFVWYNSEGKKQITAHIKLEQGFHPGEVSDENSKAWVTAGLYIRDESINEIVFDARDESINEIVFDARENGTAKALFILADGKPLFE